MQYLRTFFVLVGFSLLLCLVFRTPVAAQVTQCEIRGGQCAPYGSGCPGTTDGTLGTGIACDADSYCCMPANAGGGSCAAGYVDTFQACNDTCPGQCGLQQGTNSCWGCVQPQPLPACNGTCTGYGQSCGANQTGNGYQNYTCGAGTYCCTNTGAGGTGSGTVEGVFDSASCSQFTGWVCDTSKQTDTQTQVYFSVGAPPTGLVAQDHTTSAGQSRSDLSTVCQTANHAFSFSLPQSVINEIKGFTSNQVPIYASFLAANSGTNFVQLGQSPQTVDKTTCSTTGTPTETPPLGHFDEADCSSFRGWAGDPSKPDQPIGVDIWAVTNTPINKSQGLNKEIFIGHAIANQPRSDLTNIPGMNGRSNLGFTFSLSDPSLSQEAKTYLFSGKRIELTAFAINVNTTGATEPGTNGVNNINIGTLSNTPSGQNLSCTAPAGNTSCPKHNQGDANCDGKIDTVDVEILRSQWKDNTPKSLTAPIQNADFNDDGVVNDTDWNTLKTNYGNANNVINSTNPA